MVPSADVESVIGQRFVLSWITRTREENLRLEQKPTMSVSQLQIEMFLMYECGTRRFNDIFIQ
jgi:hypothetical protein